MYKICHFTPLWGVGGQNMTMKLRDVICKRPLCKFSNLNFFTVDCYCNLSININLDPINRGLEIIVPPVINYTLG